MKQGISGQIFFAYFATNLKLLKFDIQNCHVKFLWVKLNIYMHLNAKYMRDVVYSSLQSS